MDAILNSCAFISQSRLTISKHVPLIRGFIVVVKTCFISQSSSSSSSFRLFSHRTIKIFGAPEEKKEGNLFVAQSISSFNLYENFNGIFWQVFFSYKREGNLRSKNVLSQKFKSSVKFSKPQLIEDMKNVAIAITLLVLVTFACKY